MAMVGIRMTPTQIELARHALGLPNRRNRSYRNHFVCGPGNSDFDNWTAMVTAGFARHRNGGVLSGGEDVFWLTEAGARMALKAREGLDREDFPVALRGVK